MTLDTTTPPPHLNVDILLSGFTHPQQRHALLAPALHTVRPDEAVVLLQGAGLARLCVCFFNMFGVFVL